MFLETIAAICLVWYVFVVVVCTIGYAQLKRHYSSPPSPAKCVASLPLSEIPHVTVIRPVKGLEPNLYECLAATFRQTYPREKLTVYFCVSDSDDPAIPVLRKLLSDFPKFDARIFVENDPALQNTGDETAQAELGPNPKIRNMSRAYREAKGDIIWIIDCNIWAGKGVCGRMVDMLCGFGGKKKNKFVHQLPLVIDTISAPTSSESQRLLSTDGMLDEDLDAPIASTSTAASALPPYAESESLCRRLWNTSGGRLEELFMSSSHAKFYTAINTVLLAPCIVGKSNMFRRSHLNYLTSQNPARGVGIDFFSHNICEDHLIGDLLWKCEIPEEKKGEKWGKHALVFGDMAFQPMAGMSVGDYVARRVRWLRVRKFTVMLATLVEPGTESFLCSAYGAVAVTNLPFFREVLHVPPTWASFVAFWLLSVTVWALVDWAQYQRLHSGASVETDEDTPTFAQPSSKNKTHRGFVEWFLAWLSRECLAFPIWAWAVYGGTRVVWRGKRFWVGIDMRVHELVENTDSGKARTD